MSPKRLSLIALLVSVIAFGSFLLLTNSNKKSDFEGQWLAYMPELEASQLKNPDHMLVSAHHRVSNYPDWIAMENGEVIHLLPKIASMCRVSDYMLVEFDEGISSAETLQMPPRILIKHVDRSKEDCLKKYMPDGYVLERLSKPHNVGQLSWNPKNLTLLTGKK